MNIRQVIKSRIAAEDSYMEMVLKFLSRCFRKYPGFMEFRRIGTIAAMIISCAEAARSKKSEMGVDSNSSEMLNTIPRQTCSVQAAPASFGVIRSLC